jgi:L-amino acid N-acyltransferase YncA
MRDGRAIVSAKWGGDATMDLLVREARLDDAEAIVRILNSIIETGLYTALDTPFTVEAERQFIANLPERGFSMWQDAARMRRY